MEHLSDRSAPRTVKCPRCGRTGHVSRDERHADWFTIDWEPREGSAKWKAWGPTRDRGVAFKDLPPGRTPGVELGCGFDSPADGDYEDDRIQGAAVVGVR